MGFALQLPDARQKIVRDDIAAARQAIRPLRLTVREARDEANSVLSMEPFDKDRYMASMDKVSEAESRLRRAMASALAETAAKLTPEERVRLRAWREKRRSHMFGGHGRREGLGHDDGEADGMEKNSKP